MKLVVEIDVIGNTGIAARVTSDEITGDDAVAMVNEINERLESLKYLQIPEKGHMVCLTRELLAHSIIRLRVTK